ncbi:MULTISPECIES: sarcosine oxidase [unclassified Acinetobacter]|uniref:sarcosine oxidase n=1 Tax=unclassified Acinetobacter TaxID=196816 RepID=UPI00293465F3|nr:MULTISPECIES: sarcosine oxidase [unclassified Acinetobacter]WOE32446.1 sarcosine oxidase [Acinetobacter sp. SAAs470]WOE37921.1 sarcosine oxidase [Acinetobacter sp. SAAs474]
MNRLYPTAQSPIQQCSPAYQIFGQDTLLLAGDDLAQIQQCAIIDLTHLPRVGFRGLDSADFLTEHGFQVPEQPNSLCQQKDGSLVAKLSHYEYLLLGGLLNFGENVRTLEQDWRADGRANYLLARQDSHAWIQLTGHHIAQVMAKLCAVDLSADAFSVGQVVQTSIARINGIILNVSDLQTQKFNILCDRAAALYLWQVLLDAIAEFGGKAAGVDALLNP